MTGKPSPVALPRLLLAAGLVFFLFASASSAAGSGGAEWMEILPYSSWESKVVVLSTDGPAEAGTSEQGAALVCIGGKDVAITCEERFLRLGEPIELPQPEPGTAVSGRVLVNGEAASGVRVALVPAGLTARRPLRLPLGLEDGKIERELVTDARGRFLTPPLAASTYRLELIPPGGRVELLEPFFVPRPEDLLSEDRQAPPSLPLLELGDLEVTPGLAVEISVIDDSGAPVGGAVVAASQTKQPGRVAMMFNARTDVEGYAILRGFEPGPVRTTCAKQGFSRLEQKFDFPPTWVECVLQPLARLTGEVLSDAEGLADVTVSLAGRDRWARTDSSVRFQLPELDAGAYHLVVAAPGFQVVERSDTLAPGELRAEIIELEPAPPRWGRVVDAATGEPVAGARVVSVAPRGAVACSSNSEGELFFAAASNRQMMLEVSARGYPSRRVELGPEDGTGDEPWVVELETGGWISVTVWSAAADGPCVGCDVVIQKVAAAGVPPLPTVGVRTGEAGLATSEDLPPGHYRIILEEVWSLGSSVHVRSGDNLKLADVRPGAVTEVVFGEPRQTVEIRFRPPPTAGWRLTCAGTAGEETYDAQADGSFKVRRHPGEALALRLVGNGVSVSQGVLAAETGDLVQIDLPRTSVAGRLTEDMPALSGLKFRPLTQNGSGAWVMPAPGGRFEVSFLPAGGYRIMLGDQELAELNLVAGEALDLGEVSAQEDP